MPESTLPDTNGFVSITQAEWSEVSVRKVLHTFAYGGLANDSQIDIWAGMSPEMAIKEMLIVEPFNDKLSPPEDAARSTTGELEDLQALWSSDAVENTIRVDRRDSYSPLVPDFSGKLTASLTNLQTTWVQAATTRGLNPFRHKVGLFLTNYLMAAPNGDVRSFLLRTYYDDLLLIKTTIPEIPKARIYFTYEIFNEKGMLLNKAETTLVFINKQSMKPIPAPQMIIDKMKEML